MNTTGVSSITLNGEVVDLFFGSVCNSILWDYLREDESNDLMKPNGNFTILGTMYILYCGYKHNSLRKELKQKYKLGDFIAYADECSLSNEKTSEMEAAIMDYVNSMYCPINIKKDGDIGDEDKEDDTPKKKVKRKVQ